MSEQLYKLIRSDFADAGVSAAEVEELMPLVECDPDRPEEWAHQLAKSYSQLARDYSERPWAASLAKTAAEYAEDAEDQDQAASAELDYGPRECWSAEQAEEARTALVTSIAANIAAGVPVAEPYLDIVAPAEAAAGRVLLEQMRARMQSSEAELIASMPAQSPPLRRTDAADDYVPIGAAAAAGGAGAPMPAAAAALSSATSIGNPQPAASAQGPYPWDPFLPARYDEETALNVRKILETNHVSSPAWQHAYKTLQDLIKDLRQREATHRYWLERMPAAGNIYWEDPVHMMDDWAPVGSSEWLNALAKFARRQMIEQPLEDTWFPAPASDDPISAEPSNDSDADMPAGAPVSLRALSSAGSLRGDPSLEHLLPRQVSLHGAPSGLMRQQAYAAQPAAAAQAHAAAAAAAQSDDDLAMAEAEIHALVECARAGAEAAYAEMAGMPAPAQQELGPTRNATGNMGAGSWFAPTPAPASAPGTGLGYTRNAWGYGSMFSGM